MLFRAPLAVLLLALTGCHAQSEPFPSSSKLAPSKVKAIAATITQRYPNLSAEQHDAVLRTVVRSLDEMVFIEGGEFDMGDFGWPCDRALTELCEWPCGVPLDQLCVITENMEDSGVHPVRLSNFHLARYQTRLGDFDLFQVIRGKPLSSAEYRDSEHMQKYFLPDKPAPTRYWQEAKDYCLWLGELSGVPVDLPSEAQWEFAARNRGQHVIYPTDTGTLDFGRNYPPREDDWQGITYPVGSFAPNPLGLYDMAGNAKDWVNDWYDPDYYPNSPLDNPKGPETGVYKIMRGFGLNEAPSILANTVIRWPEAPDQTGYSEYASFRCSVQSEHPLK